MSTIFRKKLIEVALPLPEISTAAAFEKTGGARRGHPSTLHFWWARRPLAAARAVLFGQLVDDPSAWPDLWPTATDQDRERERLFDVIRAMVPWEASTDDAIIYSARFEIARSHARAVSSAKALGILSLAPEGATFQGGGATAEARRLVDDYLAAELPPVHDPFAGGGTIPLEAQRLGLRAIASDLNPVAVLINKALIEIPPKFAGRAPVNPETRGKTGLRSWRAAEGLAEDVRYFGRWMRDQAWKRIAHLYPQVDLPSARGAGKGTVIAWLWARTVASPNPAFAGLHVPLVSNFWLSRKEGKEAWVEPVVEGKTWRFEVRTGKSVDQAAISVGTKLGRGANFRCVLSGAAIEPGYIKAEGLAKRMGARLMAIVAEGKRERIYLAPVDHHENVAASAKPQWTPTEELPNDPRNLWTVNYGLTRHADLFTRRQLAALTTFSDLVSDVRERATAAAREVGWGELAASYGDALALYAAFGIDRFVNASTSLCTWDSGPAQEKIRFTFSRQALPMTWDFAEANPFSEASGNFVAGFEWLGEALSRLPAAPGGAAFAADAMEAAHPPSLISTDPPYYDNIAYADLSDLFYVWLRRSLRAFMPSEFSTVVVPKSQELIAAPYRHGGKDEAEAFFLRGMTKALGNIASEGLANELVTIYYAFKQAETRESDTSSTGWETFLDALVQTGFAISGTWPVRTELSNRPIASGTNALSSSIVLVCRKRPADATTTSRADFRRLLRAELPTALKALQHGHIAPVDLAQASIGPGMAIFSRHARVMEPDGSAMTVRTALQLINEALDEYLSTQEGELDADTRFGVTWFESHAFEPGPYGIAETLAKARNVSVEGVERAGLIKQAAGRVRLLKRAEMPDGWDPAKDDRPTVWEATQHLIKRLETEGEQDAAALVRALGSAADQARDLAYRLYNICERKGWAEEARAYNGLVIAWPELQKLASAGSAMPVAPSNAQGTLPLDAPPAKKRKRNAATDKHADSPSRPMQGSLALDDEPLFRGKAAAKGRRQRQQEPDAE